MRKIIIIIFAALFLPICSSFAATIPLPLLCNRVKSFYADTTSYCLYTGIIRDISKLKFDESSNFDIQELPLWLSDTISDKWVVFVDEAPSKNWSHECSYFIAPKEYRSILNFPMQRLDGRKPSRYVELEQNEKVNCNPLLQPIHSPDSSIYNLPSPTCFLDNDYVKFQAYIIGGGFTPQTNSKRFWNDCSYLYNVLIDKYNVCPYDIYMMFAPGLIYDDLSGSFLYRDNEFGHMPDVFCTNSKDQIYELMTGHYDLDIRDDTHILVFVAGHGDKRDIDSRPYIELWQNPDENSEDDHRLYDYELKEILDSLKAKTMTVVLGQCFSGAFINTLKAPGRVILTACGPDEYSWGYNEYDAFLRHWINAINEEGVDNEFIASDIDGNGRVTMNEAFEYAQTMDEEDETPMYSSVFESTGEDLSLNHTPWPNELYIKDNLADTGKEYNTTDSVFWDSPDIWIRNSNDGETTRECTHMNVNSNGKLYIYTQIINRGFEDYRQTTPFNLHLYWTRKNLGLSKNSLFQSNQTMGDFIATIPINQNITAGDSIIIEYEWTVPSELSALQNEHGLLDIDLVARIDTSATYLFAGPSMTEPWKENSVATKKYTVISPSKGLNKVEYVQNGSHPATRFYKYETFPVYISADNNFSISLSTMDSLSTSDSFAEMEVYLNLSPTLYSNWVNGGCNMGTDVVQNTSDPRKFKISGDNNYLSGFSATSGDIDSLYLTVQTPVSYSFGFNHMFDIEMKDSENNIIDGERILVYEKDNGGGAPIIQALPQGNLFMLSADNIEAASSCEWYNHMEKIGEGLNVTVDSGDYLLQVDNPDGEKKYATITLNPNPELLSISPNPFSSEVIITLTNNATSNTFIRITPTNGVTPMIERQIPEDNNHIVISTLGLSSGTYIVQLFVDNVPRGSAMARKL